MIRGYLWNGKEVVVYDNDYNLSVQQAQAYGLENMPCVDLNCEVGHGRYGLFEQDDEDGGCAWKELDIREFPPEFRTHLLLLGVS